MERVAVRAPVGMDDLVSTMEEICEKREGHKRAGPTHFVINLDSGNGQTTATQYVAECLQANRIRPSGALDAFLEFKTDGSLQQMKQIFARISSASVYKNLYGGVISFDITALSSNPGGQQTDFFVSEVGKLRDSATLIFFTGSNPSSGLLSIISKLKKEIRRIRTIHILPYTEENIAQIVERGLKDRGIRLEPADDVHSGLCEIARHRQASTAQHALDILEDAVIASDYSGSVPVLSATELPVVFPECFGKESLRK